MGRKADACGSCSASRFIRQKTEAFLFLLSLALCELGKEVFFLKNQIRTLALAAMFTAMSVIVGVFCKNFMNFGGGLFRITFENLPIIMSGIMFGPLVAATVGVAADFLSYLMSAQIYPPNLIVTLGAAMVGISSGIVSKYIIKKQGYAQIILSGAIAHIVGSMIIKTAGLFTFYGAAVLWRIPLYLMIAPIEIIVICLLYRNTAFRSLMERNRYTK